MPAGRMDWRRVHLWQIQPVRDILVLLAIFGLLYVGYILRVVTVPMLLALLLAYLFEPVVCAMTRVRWISRQGAAAAIIVITAVVIVVPVTLGAGYAIVQGGALVSRFARNVSLLNTSLQNPASDNAREALPNDAWRYVRDHLVSWEERAAEEMGDDPEAALDPAAGDAPDSAPAPDSEPAALPAPVSEESDPDAAVGGRQSPDGSINPAEPLPPERRTFVSQAIDQIAAWARQHAEAIGAQALETGAGAVGFILRALASIGMIAFGGFLTAFFFFFFSTGYGRVRDFWEGLIPERKRGRAVELVHRMDRVIAGFIRGRLTICAVQIVFFTLAYTIIGVPAPLIIGPIVGLLCIVPYVALVSIPLTIILMWLEPAAGGFRDNWWWVIGAPSVAYFIGQALDDYVFTPLIQGKSTNMDTPTILFASLAGGVLAGVYGLLIAIPVAACIKILMVEVFWPHFRAWTEGKVADPLPLARAPVRTPPSGPV